MTEHAICIILPYSSILVAVDFTNSNGNPAKPESLHFQAEGYRNPYQVAIQEIAGILEDYDSDKYVLAVFIYSELEHTLQFTNRHECRLYPIYGFGGRVDNKASKQPRHTAACGLTIYVLAFVTGLRYHTVSP